MSMPLDTLSQETGVDVSGLTAGYRPIAGIYDEMCDDAGTMRPHWLPLIEALARLGTDGARQRFALADEHLASSGVFYRVYEDRNDVVRKYPLSHVPLVVPASDWSEISAGLTERADLIERILADAYGNGDLCAAGRLPAAVLTGSPEYLRPLRHVRPRNGRFLGFYAADIGRDARGRWWVLRDRTQAPSGSGYALENRIALSRALGEVYAEYCVERLAGFFDELRGALSSQRDAGDAGVCFLSPGPLNEAYFEHVYLSRYLGFRLVEGQDLTVQDERVYLRTVRGLRAVNVILRRIDADFADPLELNTGSRLGIPGLVGALRAGNVSVVNALGTGLMEAPAFMGFLPALAPHVLGRGLAMPNVATWWCGQPAERRHVLERFEDHVLAPAFDSAARREARLGRDLRPEEHQRLRADIARRGLDYVGQEQVHLSTMPVWEDGRLQPRPFTLRVYLVATATGWAVMPGGMALVGNSPDPTMLSMQHGARAADVWVLSGGQPSPQSLLASAESIEIRRASAALPSRAADNLFWFARYLERAETTVRVVRALSNRSLDFRPSERSEIAALGDLLFQWGAIAGPAEDTFALATALANRTMSGSVVSLIASARQAGAAIRNRFPVEGWRALESIDASLSAGASALMQQGDLEGPINAVLRDLAAIAGIGLDHMNRLSGWRFMKLGSRIERAILLSRLSRRLALGEASATCLDALLEIDGCQITYRVRYPHGAARKPVLDLVLLDDSNPRSLAFALSQIEEHMGALALLDGEVGRAAHPRPMIDLLAAFAALDVARLEAQHLVGIENLLMQLSNHVTSRYFDLRGNPRHDGEMQA